MNKGFSNIENTNLTVKIVKCSRNTYWYRNSIGKIFDIISEDDEDYYLPSQLILKDDCIVINKRLEKLNRIL